MRIKHADVMIVLPLDRGRRCTVRAIYRSDRRQGCSDMTARKDAERLAFYMTVIAHPDTTIAPRNAAAVAAERAATEAYLAKIGARP